MKRPSDKEWQKQATNLLKAELTRRGVSYDQLKEKLALLNVQETAAAINAKINRGTFSFMFFLQVMKAVEGKNLRIEND